MLIMAPVEGYDGFMGIMGFPAFTIEEIPDKLLKDDLFLEAILDTIEPFKIEGGDQDVNTNSSKSNR